MIKQFKTFEAHLKTSKGEQRDEFKFSSSLSSVSKLNKLTEWYDQNSITFLDLTKVGVSIKQVVGEKLKPNDEVILVRPTTYELHLVENINMSKYRLFKIFGVPDDFPTKYAIISDRDFMNNRNYSTLNLNKLQRGDNKQEMVLLIMIAIMLEVPLDNGIKVEEYNSEWDELITYYEQKFPHNMEKMEKQLDTLFSTVGYDWDLVVKDNSSFFVNRTASDLFYDNDEYREKGYIFNLDKWNPSDFWLVKGDINEYKNVFKYSLRSLEELNSWLNNSIKDNVGIIGISHKLGNKERTYLNKVNVDGKREPFRHEYIGYLTSPNSMSVDIEYKWENLFNKKEGTGKITIRNFSGGNRKKVAMEIYGDGHMSGKLTGYLRPLFGDTDFFDLQNEIINSSSEDSLVTIIDEFNLEPEIYDSFMEVLNDDTKPWDYKKMSKLQGLLIVDKILKHPKGEDWVIHEMVNYGRSQTTISAPHYVIK